MTVPIYIPPPTLSWQTCLTKSNISLKLLTNIDVLLTFENGIRRSLSVISHRHAKTNVPGTPGFPENKTPSYIMYWDANNFYGYAMSKYLSYGEFQ